MTEFHNPRDRAVRHMFDRIARRYDLLNKVISFRMDKRWRDHAIRRLGIAPNSRILDLGAGTGDLTFAAAETAQNTHVVGLDVSAEMLKVAQARSRRAPHGIRIHFVHGSALRAPFREGAFDGVMSAFVLRNVSDLALFFDQAFRVLRPGGKIVTLDMFPPSKPGFKALYGCYFYRVVPWIGALLARDREAYRYLSESVKTFRSPAAVAEILQHCGFTRVVRRDFLCGAVCMHVAEKSPAMKNPG